MKPKLIHLTVTIALALFASASFAQSLIVPNMVSVAQDTVIKNQLISSLNGFLSAKEGPNKDNPYVLKEDILETSALLDEMKDVEQSNRFNDKNFYKCHLTNVVKLEGNNYIVQVSYIGYAEGTPVLRASFRLLARNKNKQFYFASPLKQNTRSWKIRKGGNIIFHYKDTLFRGDAEVYYRTVSYYDRKLKVPSSVNEFYYCDHFPEALQLLGIDYKSDYNGIKSNDLSSAANNESIVLSGYNSYNHRFDPHDLWHERLRMVMSNDIINRPVDEGCAYFYGGSWGLKWAEVLGKFKQYAAENPNADWRSLYTETKNFVEGDKSLKVAYALNALIVQKIERQKGFAAVMELLSCGKREAGDDNYFKALEKITGITKANFNMAMWELIKGS